MSRGKLNADVALAYNEVKDMFLVFTYSSIHLRKILYISKTHCGYSCKNINI